MHTITHTLVAEAVTGDKLLIGGQCFARGRHPNQKPSDLRESFLRESSLPNQTNPWRIDCMNILWIFLNPFCPGTQRGCTLPPVRVSIHVRVMLFGSFMYKLLKYFNGIITSRRMSDLKGRKQRYQRNLLEVTVVIRLKQTISDCECCVWMCYLASVYVPHGTARPLQWAYKKTYSCCQTLQSISYGQACAAGAVVSAGSPAHHSLQLHGRNRCDEIWSTASCSGKKMHWLEREEGSWFTLDKICSRLAVRCFSCSYLLLQWRTYSPEMDNKSSHYCSAVFSNKHFIRKSYTSCQVDFGDFFPH